MFTAEEPEVLSVTVPVTVNPPVPCKSPVPELTPTAVMAPAWVTVKLVEVIRLVAKVPEMLMPLVMLEAVPARIFSPSVVTIWLPVAVSLFSKDRMEATVASVEDESFCLRAILAAVSVLPATEVFWVNCRSKPAMEPVDTAVVP